MTSFSFSLLKTGGFTMIVLSICSVISWGVALERFWYYWKRSRVKREDFMHPLAEELGKGDLHRAIELSGMVDTPFAHVVHEGLSLFGHDKQIVSNAMERGIALETSKLQKGTSINGTIGSVAVYIGLFGTVLGIMNAFHHIAKSNSGGFNVAINGISEALVCTAAGLVVAVPAVIVYNYFVKRIDRFVLDMELCASEVLDLSQQVRQ